MVDTDRIPDSDGGGSSSSGGSSGSRKRKEASSGSSDANSGANIQSGPGEDHETQGEKMKKMKKAKGIDTDDKIPDRVDDDKVANVLEAMANILLYTEGKMRSYKSPSTEREVKECNTTSKIYEQFTSIISESQVQRVCEKYGIDWEDDVLQSVISDQDFGGGADSAMDESEHVININTKKGVSRDDFYRFVMTIGHMFMFTKTLEEKFSRGGSRQEDMALDAVEDISAKCIDFTGSFSVVEISDEYGISWEDDVIDRIAEGDVSV